MLKKNIIITGGNGFVGKNILKLLGGGFNVYSVQRRFDRSESLSDGCITYITYKQFFEMDFDSDTVFIHLAGAAHKKFLYEEAKCINFDLTKKLLDRCIELKISKFIFLSSANVYKEQDGIINLTSQTSKNLPNTISTKLLAEVYIQSITDVGLINSVIIRSPLIYGEDVKANFASLMRFVGKGLPLPFKAIKSNKRSFVSIYNLVDLIKVCIDNPKAANQVFLVSDDHDLSTAEVVELMANVQGKKNFALPVPVWCFKLAGKLLNKSDVIDRLTGSLQLDISHTKNTLDWKPPFSVEHGFKLAAEKPSTK